MLRSRSFRTLAAVGAAFATATVISGPALAAPPAPTVDYVALGDSYASGVGDSSATSMPKPTW